ncbi:hypothetical protein QYM36_007895, partial [Artemia franciscana]
MPPAEENISEFKKYKSQLSKILRLEKRKYYKRKFEKVRLSLKRTWSLINEYLSKRKGTLPDEMFMLENQVPLNDKEGNSRCQERAFCCLIQIRCDLESAASSRSS